MKITWFDKFKAEKGALISIGWRNWLSVFLYFRYSSHSTQKQKTKSIFALGEKKVNESI